VKTGIRLGIGILALLFTGCAHTKGEVEPEPVVPVIVEEKPTEGSIWKQGMSDWYRDRRAHGLGDIVTVNIVEEASASQEASTQTARDSDLDASLDDTFGLPTDYGIGDFLGAGQSFSPTLKGDYKRGFKGSGSTVRKDKLVASVTATVVEVIPGGNLRIRGKRQINVNREKQFISLEGIIRPDDISASNTVISTKIAEAKIRYSGRGVLGDVQGPGWLARIMDWIWPL